MTKQGLEILIEQAASWPRKAQEELIQSMASIGRKHLGTYRLSKEERVAIRRGLLEVRAGKLASTKKVAALFARYHA